MDRLILDTLNPPSPDQLVADLDAVGADGAAVYVWRPGGIGTWTPAHVVKLRAAGKLAFPVIVPQSDGGDINGMLGMAQFFGFMSGPITIDAEFPNLPPATWEEAFDRAAATNGFSDFDYGTLSDLGLYQPDNQDWVAEWIRTGQLQPLPALPAGRPGWQFVNDITINGHLYDASVIAGSVFGEEEPMTPQERDSLSRALIRLAYLAGGSREPESQDAISHWLDIMNQQGFENAVAEIADSIEFSKDESLDQQIRLDYAAGKLGGSVTPQLVPHDHQVTTSGTSGPAQAT